MDHIEDLRITKTKLAIKSSLFQLLNEKPFEKITVSDITTRASVNRGTFYCHYKDKYDLIEQIEHDIITDFSNFVTLLTEETVSKSLAEHSPLPHFVPLLTYIENNPDFFLLIAKNNTGSSFYEKVVNKYFYQFMKVMHYSEDKWTEYRKDIALSIIRSILNRWICDGMKESKEELATWLTESMLSIWNALKTTT